MVKPIVLCMCYLIPWGIPRGVAWGIPPRGVFLRIPWGIPHVPWGVTRGIPRGSPGECPNGSPRGVTRGILRGMGQHMQGTVDFTTFTTLPFRRVSCAGLSISSPSPPYRGR